MNYIESIDSISFYYKGKPYCIPVTSHLYFDIVTALKTNASLDDVLQRYNNFADLVKSTFSTEAGKKLIDETYDSFIQSEANKAINSRNEKLFNGLICFVKKLKRTRKDIRTNLFEFLKKIDLELTDTGDFIGYRAVRKDFFDKYSGTVKYPKRGSISIPKEEAQFDPDISCGKGLHVGNIQYVQGYASDPTDRILMVSVNPQHVVSVPNHDSNKLRCYKMTVIKEIPRDEFRKL